MNNYETKQETRRQRYLDRAEQARQEFQTTHDRNYRGRIHDTFGKAFAALDKAKHYEDKTASVGHGGISYDDPDALQKLRAKLEEMENSQAMMKAANQAIRRHKTDEARAAALVALGFTEANAQILIKPDYVGRVGFPAFSLSNNNANMRRVKERIAAQEASRQPPDQGRIGRRLHLQGRLGRKPRDVPF